jgi:hypothetical protein
MNGGVQKGPAERHQRRLRQERLEKLARDALRRIGMAETYRSATVRIENRANGEEWLPAPHYCHDNAKIWVTHTPAHKRVKGFVVLGPLFGVYKVMAHSLIEVEDGTLVDITPHGASQHYPFVRHIGSDEDFEEFADEIEVSICAP